MPGRTKPLSEEDRILWNLVVRGTRPLKGRRPAISETLPEPQQQPRSAAGAVPPPPALPPAHGASRFDRPMLSRISRGRVPIEMRLDLHGMTQELAHPLLLSFLKDARSRNMRHVLVITGKGSGGEGVLRRAVPAWLATAPFRDVVSAFAGAARGHGGEGALYVRLRRPKGGDR